MQIGMCVKLCRTATARERDKMYVCMSHRASSHRKVREPRVAQKPIFMRMEITCDGAL